MLAAIFNFIGLPIVGRIFDTVESLGQKIADLKIARLNAETNQEKLRLDAEIRSLELRQSALVEQSKGKYGLLVIIPQFLLGMAVVVVMWKIVVYDQALGQWTGGFTHKLGDDVWQFIKIVTGFYFVTTWLRK